MKNSFKNIFLDLLNVHTQKKVEKIVSLTKLQADPESQNWTSKERIYIYFFLFTEYVRKI